MQFTDKDTFKEESLTEQGEPCVSILARQLAIFRDPSMSMANRWWHIILYLNTVQGLFYEPGNTDFLFGGGFRVEVRCA